MSEVNDAVQVIMVAGKTIYMASRISSRILSSFIKMMNTIYLSKWKGSASLHRLRQIKGDDMVFINISSERQSDLAGVEKEMKAHGILFARMPDLCGGDGRTQYAIAASDLPKLKPMLLDHAVGKEKRIRVGLISEKDYLGTGYTAEGTLTPEYEDLQKSATLEKERTSGNPLQGMYAKIDQNVYTKTSNMTPDATASGTVRTEGSMSLLRVHDLRMAGREDEYLWIDEDPILRGKGFSLYPMGDGLRGVIIPDGDEISTLHAYRQTGISTEDKMKPDIISDRHRAVIFSEQSYQTIDLKTLSIADLSGTKVMKTIRSGNIYRRNEMLRAMLKKNAPSLGQELLRASRERKL